MTLPFTVSTHIQKGTKKSQESFSFCDFLWQGEQFL